MADGARLAGTVHPSLRSGAGPISRHVADLVLKSRKLATTDPSELPLPGGVTEVMLFDRAADLLTPLCTTATSSSFWGPNHRVSQPHATLHLPF